MSQNRKTYGKKYEILYFRDAVIYIYIILIVAFNVIISILESSETKIELAGYFIFATVMGMS